MNSKTKKIITIIVAAISILICIFKVFQASIDETTSYKLLSCVVILDVILIILAVRNVINNRNSIIVIGLLASALTPSLIGIVLGTTILSISFLPSYDKPYQKQVAPKLEPVNTYKILAHILVFLLIYIIFYSGLLSLIFKWLNLAEFMQTHSVLINSIIFSIMAIVIILLLRKEIVRDVKMFFKNFSTYLNIIMPAYILGLFAEVLIGVCITLITQARATNETAVDAMPLWFLIIFAVLIGPIVEEGLFRGFLRKFIKNDVAFVIVSTLLFSLIHVIPYAFFEPIQWLFILQYATIAVPISIIYIKTNNLAVVYFFHLCWNLVAVVASAFALIA